MVNHSSPQQPENHFRVYRISGTIRSSILRSSRWYLEAETVAYRWIDGKDIGPRFLGHLTEDGRVIGFLIQEIPRVRFPYIDNLSTCQEVLARLHGLGIRHGDTNKHNMLISGERATLVDFAEAQECEDQEALEREMDGLRERLMDKSGLGGVVAMMVDDSEH